MSHNNLISTMTHFLKSIRWKKVLFPILADFNEVHHESATATIASNNFDLANDESQYQKVFKKIQEHKESKSPHNKIILTEG